jgi:hypothetical protein
MPGLTGFLSGRLVDENSGKWLIENEFQEETVTRISRNSRFIPQVLRHTLR